MKKKFIYLLFLCLLPTVGFAQTYEILGRVTEAESGQPLSGVAVRGKIDGAITNKDGEYSVKANHGDELTFSFLGLKTQKVVVQSANRINIAMEQDAMGLDDVVVVGYGVMKKSDLSGSIAQVSSDDLLRGNPSTSINQALQGRLAGVTVTQNDGAPGAGISIQIRGANSFSTSSQPLYIVDGVPFDVAAMPSGDANANNNQTSNPLALINPNNIESIEVLKDASATAIYGSRGANGVVIITTKKGKEGTEQIEFSANFSFSKVANRVKPLGAYDYANYINEQTVNDAYYMGTNYNYLPYPGRWEYNYNSAGQIMPHTGRYTASPEDFLNPRTIYDAYGNVATISNTNWQDEIYQTGFTHEYNLRVSGASEKGWHSFSGNFVDQEGTITNSGYTRHGISANLGRKIHRWIELGTNINYTNSNTDFTKSNAYDYSIIRSALMFPPTHDPRMTTSAMDELSWLAANPYMYVRSAKDKLKSNNVFTSSYAQLNFTDWLSFRQNLGISYSDNRRDTYYGRHTQEGRAPINGLGGQSDNWWKGLTAESILTFNKTFAEKHSLNVVAGFTYEQSDYGSKSITVSDFPSDITGSYDLSAALVTQKPQSDRGETSLVSLLGRVNYVYDNRYIFTVSFRRDGSSKFAKGNKFANFASGAFAWRVSEEKFMKNVDFISNLKLRLSFGQTGNQGINTYETLPIMGTANYPAGGALVSGYAEDSWRGPVNPDLKWETTNQYNAGLDIGLFNNRVNFVVDLYYKKTKDLLQNVKIPQSTGFENMRTNFGQVTNKGLELSGNFVIFDNPNFRWTMDANISFNRNEIGGLESDQFAQELWYSADQAFLQRNGHPIGTIYGFVEDGFFNNEAEVRAMKEYANSPDAVVRAMVGEVRYRDLDGNGVIDDRDRTVIGNTNPDFVYGITNTFRWKNFDFSFFLQGVSGNDMFNGNLMDVKLSNIGNIPNKAYHTRWTADNTANAKWPKATGGYNRVWRISDRYVESGSYLRLKNVSLGYTVPLKIKHIESLYFYVSAANLFTITPYSWFDPDVNSFGGDASRRGVDIYSYPNSRTYSFGLKVNF